MSKTKQTTLDRIPLWALNLLGFGFLIAMVLLMLFYQSRDIGRNLQQNGLDRAKMVATILENYLADAELAITTVDRATSRFLSDKAYFITYMHSIAPLHSEELAVLAMEGGLIGITLIRADKTHISGPQQWFPGDFSLACPEEQSDNQLIHKDKLIIFSHNTVNPRQPYDLKCIYLAMDGTDIAELRDRSSLQSLLSTISAMPGIKSVTIQNTYPKSEIRDIELLIDNHQPIARTIIESVYGTLIVDQDASHFFAQRSRIHQQFFFLSILLLALGILFSWLLYRFQQRDIEKTIKFEQDMGRQHEAAVLGRTTATITHELKNPLNTINMGLQRLQIESINLDKNQKQLVNAMTGAVKRTSAIIGELQKFTRPLIPQSDSFSFNDEIKQLLILYKQQINSHNIDVYFGDDNQVILNADQVLVSEMMENLIKNSIEAQPDGGFIDIALEREKNLISLTIKNGGFSLSREESKRVGTPYFTSKARGTGLGLALCRRITEAHNGSLTIIPDYDRQELSVFVSITDMNSNKIPKKEK
jgi:signal transduction histidine kinase